MIESLAKTERLGPLGYQILRVMIYLSKLRKQSKLLWHESKTWAELLQFSDNSTQKMPLGIHIGDNIYNLEAYTSYTGTQDDTSKTKLRDLDTKRTSGSHDSKHRKSRKGLLQKRR